MADYVCEYAYRENGKPMLFCKLMEASPYCLHQKVCGISKQYENTAEIRNCKWKTSHQKSESEE